MAWRFVIIALGAHYAGVALGQVCTCRWAQCPHSGNNVLMLASGSTATYYYRDHNGIPVVKSAVVTITARDLNTGSEVSDCARKFAQAMDDVGLQQDADAGHILAKRLGGPGHEPINIFPQDFYVNRGRYRLFEAEIYDCLSQGGAVSVKLAWDFYYRDTRSTRAQTVTYSAKYPSGSRCKSAIRTFVNS